MRSPFLMSVLVCLGAAALEGICAGKNVRAFFSSLRFPRYSAPLWVWSMIGGAYYLIFGFVLYRVFGHQDDTSLRSAATALIVAMMVGNALSNYVIFRARDLRTAFLIGAAFPIADIALIAMVAPLDAKAALALIPYLVYRPYAVYWGYGLWKANRHTGPGPHRNSESP